MSSVVKNSVPRVQPKRRVASAGETTSGADQPATLKIASPYVLEARQLFKAYRKGRHEVPVLKGCDFQAISGNVTAILGQSGSGKSTLLHMLGTLDAPDQGEIYFDGGRIDNLSRARRDHFRNTKLGMIFQFYHLLPEISALQNVLMPMMIQQGFFKYWRNRSENKRLAIELLTRVGLDHRLVHKPRELSGGEMQRAAIARALLMQPALLLADEPTGNLDSKTAAEVIALLHELHRGGQTVVLVTHDNEIAATAHRSVRLRDGKVEFDVTQ